MNRLFIQIQWVVFYIMAKLRLARLSAFLFFKTLVPLSQRDNNLHRFRMLILSGASFKEDIMTSLGDDIQFELFSFQTIRKSFKAMARAFLPSKINDMNYRSNESSTEKAKKVYCEFLRCFWKNLQRFIKFDAVVSGNFGYFAERELANALEGLGTPFIVLHKENFKSPGRVEFYKEVYRKRRGSFGGRKILVYNEIERKVQIESGVVTPDRVIITGMPRLDRIHRWRKIEKKGQNAGIKVKNQVLIFSFGEKTGLPRGLPRELDHGLQKLDGEKVHRLESWEKKYKKFGWWRLVENYHMAIIKAAHMAPSVKYVIKAKNIPPENAVMDNILSEVGPIPKNLEVIKGGDALNYILESRLVCGFNTTGLIEAIAANKPVVVPMFDEAIDEMLQPYIVDMEDTVLYAKSPKELTHLLTTAVSTEGLESTNNDLSEQRLKLIKRWTENVDGKSGQRVRNAILNEIRQSDSA